MSLPLQANKKETPIQNTPLRGPMQHKLKCARRDTELPNKSGHRRPATSRQPTGKQSSNPEVLAIFSMFPEPIQFAKSLHGH